MVELAELLDIPPPRGRRSTLVVSKRRNMEPSDIASLSQAKPLEQVSPVNQLRHQHHQLARLIAEGKSLTEASMYTGYTVAYISRLKGVDKAFQELITYYSSNVDEIYYSVHERLKGMGLNSLEELQDRLASDPTSFKHRELMELCILCFDRAGFGPVSTTKVSATILTPEIIETLKSAIASRSHGQIRQISPNSSRPHLGSTIDGRAVEEAEVERVPSERNDVSENGRKMAREEYPS